MELDALMAEETCCWEPFSASWSRVAIQAEVLDLGERCATLANLVRWPHLIIAGGTLGGRQQQWGRGSGKNTHIHTH